MGLRDEVPLEGMQLFDIVVAGTKRPKTLTTLASLTLHNKEWPCQLLSSITEGEIGKVQHCSSAQEIWSFFESTYGKKISNLKLKLMDDLNHIKIASPPDVTKSISDAMTTRGRLRELC